MIRRWLVPLVVAAAWCALILFVHRDSPRTLVSAHGLLHAAIAGEFAPDARQPPLATPPENPLFAGRPLPYYYFFHAAGARVAALLHVDAIHAFEAMELAAAVVVVLLGFWLGHHLLRVPAAGRAVGIAFALLFFAGCNPQGPLVLLARCLKDGTAALEDRGQYLWGLVHPANGAMRIGDYWGALGPLVTYFFNVTARPLALASLVVVIAALAVALNTGRSVRWLPLLGVALATTLCTLWSPLLGMASAAALGAALVLESLRRDRPAQVERSLDELARTRPLAPDQREALAASSQARFRQRFLCASALLIGVALALPWCRQLFGGASGRIAFKFNATRASGVVASAWLVGLLALRHPRWCWTGAVALPPLLRMAGLFLALPTAFVALPVGNEDNFLHAALVCWSVVAATAAVPMPTKRSEPAAAGASKQIELRGMGRRLLVLHLAFVPSLALVVFAYTSRPPIPIAFEHGELHRLPPDGREARVYAWIRASTPRDAVIVQDPGREGRACTGNTSELPAFTGRALFTDYPLHYLVSPNEDAPRRMTITRQLAGGDPLEPDDARYLAALGRAVFVVSIDDAAAAAKLRALLGAPAFEADGLSVFAWRAPE